MLSFSSFVWVECAGSCESAAFALLLVPTTATALTGSTYHHTTHLLAYVLLYFAMNADAGGLIGQIT